MSSRTVFPGDELATSEEFIPGEGTYERDGSIFASVIGRKLVYEDELMMTVQPVKEPKVLKPGDVIIGVVNNVKKQMASITLMVNEEPWHGIAGAKGAALHVSKVSESYLDDVRRMFRIGDIIRARVQQSAPSIQLETSSPELGVLRARCMKCRRTLQASENALYCEVCDRTEIRRLANDYAKFSPLYESNKK